MRRADQIDLHVGKNIRFFREKRNISQVELAATIGVSFQQLQKYEMGHNRISASRIYQIAKRVNVEVSDLYYGLDEKYQNEKFSEYQPKVDKDCIEILELYQSIKDPNIKKLVASFLRTHARNS